MVEPLPVVMNETSHRFEVELDGQTAFAEYILQHDAIVLPHTVVPDAFEGRGVGGQLASAALTYAREHGLRVKPSCPFMAAYIKRHAEWHDLVHKDYRARLGLEP